MAKLYNRPFNVEYNRLHMLLTINRFFDLLEKATDVTRSYTIPETFCSDVISQPPVY